MNEKNTDEVVSFEAETEVPSTPITEASLTINEPSPQKKSSPLKLTDLEIPSLPLKSKEEIGQVRAMALAKELDLQESSESANFFPAKNQTPMKEALSASSSMLASVPANGSSPGDI